MLFFFAEATNHFYQEGKLKQNTLWGGIGCLLGWAICWGISWKTASMLGQSISKKLTIKSYEHYGTLASAQQENPDRPVSLVQVCGVSHHNNNHNKHQQHTHFISFL